jgi:GNAT superfamily N-acetyltransferase
VAHARQSIITIRSGTIADAATIAHHRRAMFTDVGHTDTDALDAMTAAFLPWLHQKMANAEYLAWLAEHEGSIVAGLGLWLMDWPPHMIGPGAPRGNILNVYTELAFRRQGIARRIMETALEWCQVNKVRAVILHASDDGRKLYEDLDFKSTNEMRILLPDS